MTTAHNWQSVQRQSDPLNSTLARRAVKAYPRTEYTDRKAVNTLRRGWIRQITYLGDKWLLATPIPKKQAGNADIIVLATTSALTLIAIAHGWPL